MNRYANNIRPLIPTTIAIMVVVGAVLMRIPGLTGWDASGLLPRLTVPIGTFSTIFLGIFIEALPFLLLGTFSSGVVEVMVAQDDLARWMPKNAFLGAAVGSLLGLFFPVCECGAIPLARRLFLKGAPLPVGVAFLLAAPVINPVVIGSTFAAFGNSFIFWGRLAATILIALCVGVIFSLERDPTQILLPVDVSSGDCVSCGGEKTPLPVQRAQSGWWAFQSERWVQVGRVSIAEFFEMGQYLVAGALLAALMQTFVPQAALLSVGQGPLLSVLALNGLAFILSICSTVDAFVALAFIGTFSSGAILSFLVFGPMVDIKSLMMLLKVFRRKTVIYLALLPFVLTLVMGVIVNYFISW